MTNSKIYFKVVIGFCWILLQVSNSWCKDISSSVVKILSDDDFICAGTLVKGDLVVTSADCLLFQTPGAPLTVVGNGKDVKDIPAHKSSVIDISIPKDYNEETRYLDVAVLKLEKSIASSQVKPAELCSKSSIEQKELILYYWVLRSKSESSTSGVFELLTATYAETYKNLCALWYKTEFSNTMFCAKYRKGSRGFAETGSPVASGRKFCGIYNNYGKDIDRSIPASFTSLDHPEVIKFIQGELEK